MKRSQRVLGTFFILVLAWAMCALLPRSANGPANNSMMKQEENLPLLIAHGGGNREFPDNTLEAFYNAYSIDSECMMETDVSITSDGIVILSHDTTLDRKTNLRYADIAEINYSYLVSNEVDFSYQNQVTPSSNGYNETGEFNRYTNYLNESVTPLDVTYPDGVSPRHPTKFLVTTLEDLIIAFPNNRINVEIKQSGEIGISALQGVLTLMDNLDAQYDTFNRIVLASFHDEITEQLAIAHKTSHPTLLYSPGTQGVITYFALQLLRLDAFYREPVAALQVPVEQYGISLATKSFVTIAHQHQMAVHYWTIDDEETMLRLIELGVDGIMTNIPSRLKSVYTEYENR